MGVVYRAERLKLGKIVAIKVLHDELPNELSSRKRFELEAMAMAKLEHPHCAAVLDVGMHEDKPYVVMDFITGTDLKTLIDQGPVAIPRAVEIVKQTLSGVAHAHELGIIHRDIKPANIILGQKTGLGDHVKILDFGLARLTQDQQTSRLTSGIVVGTPAYMAPEQIRGLAIDARCDLYSCGVLLFELLTGHKPFHSVRDDPMEVVSMHLKQAPPRLADKLAGVDFGLLEDVVAKALQKKPEDRFQTAAEFVAALDGLGTMQITESMMLPQGGTKLGIPVAPDVRSAPVPQPYGVDLPTQPSAKFGLVEVAEPTPRPGPPPAAAPALPFSKKQLAIAGGGVLAVIILIAAIAGGSAGRKSPPADAAVAPAPTEKPPEADGAQQILARAADLAATGEREAALDLLTKSRAVYATNAELPYLAGKLYFGKLWWTDGLKQFRDAVRLEPRYRTDPELIKIVLKGFITTPSYNDELAQFLRTEIGASAAQYLEETARDHPNAAIRARAKSELARYVQ